MSELKRCPFCGGEATLCNYYFVQCEECGVSTLTFITKEEAIKAWNTRKPMQNIVERLEEKKTKSYVTGITANPYEFGACHAMNDAIKIVKEEGGIDGSNL